MGINLGSGFGNLTGNTSNNAPTGGVLNLNKNDILDLTKSEISICSILISNMGRVLSREEIVEKMAEKGINTTERSVREYIRKIRSQFKKAKINPIKTVSKQGYKWILDKCENE